MLKGPNGQERPIRAIGLAVMIGKIATGQIEETQTTTLPKAGRRKFKLRHYPAVPCIDIAGVASSMLATPTSLPLK